GGIQISGTEGGVVGIIGHVCRNAIQYRAHLHDDIRDGQCTLENTGAVRLCEDCLFEWAADLALVYVECRNKLDVAAAITADRRAHHTFHRGTVLIPIEFDTLHQGAGTIAHAGNGYLDLVCPGHWPPSRHRLQIRVRAPASAFQTNAILQRETAF